jgi:hypothetical protein
MLKGRGITILFLLLGIMWIPAQGQEWLGLSTNNYSGIWGGQMNPASLTGNKTYLDINLIGGGLNFSNNFAYIPKDDYSLFYLITADTIIPIYGKYRYNGYYTYYKNKNPKWMVMNNRITGPSALYQFNKDAFAVSFSFRTAASGVNVPWELLVFMYEDLSYPPLQGIRFKDQDFSISELSWEEMSFSYAREIYNRYGNTVSVGITGKLLFGLAGGYSDFPDVDYKAIDSKTVHFYHFNADVAFSIPESGLKNVALNPFNSSGFGLGADIGIVYTKLKNRYGTTKGKRPCATPYADYQYKIGLSLIDIGGISFNKNTEFHTFDVENIEVSSTDLDSLKGMPADFGMRYLSKLLTGDSLASLVDNRMRIGLPTAVNLQFDWHPAGPYYISMIWVQPLHFHLKDVKRAAQLALIPRYETRWLGVSLPVSLLQYQKPRIGLALRLYTFTVGTECLGTILNFSNLDNVDIYFSLKLSLDKGLCNPYKRGACDKGEIR